MGWSQLQNFELQLLLLVCVTRGGRSVNEHAPSGRNQLVTTQISLKLDVSAATDTEHMIVQIKAQLTAAYAPARRQWQIWCCQAICCLLERMLARKS